MKRRSPGICQEGHGNTAAVLSLRQCFIALETKLKSNSQMSVDCGCVQVAEKTGVRPLTTSVEKV